MADFKLEISADTVAWYAAIVATASACVVIFNAWRDRPRIKISLRRNMKIYPPDPGNEDKTFIMLDVANVGRRPVTITHAGFETTENDILAADSVKQGSRELAEGKSTSYLVDESGICFEELRKVIVVDATGKEYRKRVPKKFKKKLE